MIKIKLTTLSPKWPLERQTPDSTGVWRNCKFFINQNIKKCDYWVVFGGLKEKEKAICPKTNTIFIMGEPTSIKRYNPKFLKQFETIITSQRNIKHSNVIHKQQALPWMIGGKYDKKTNTWPNFSKNYNELTAITNIKKSKLISVITSKKEFTKGHRQRLKFVNELKKHFGDKVSIFGRDINNFVDKWDVIAPYRYHISLENSSYKDYWTEKLSDTFLAGAYPIYYGCPNIYDYFSKNSLTTIDIKKPEKAIKIIENIIQNNQYEKSIEKITSAKKLILDKYNLFPMISDIINKRKAGKPLKYIQITLKPEFQYPKPIYTKITSIILNKIKQWKK